MPSMEKNLENRLNKVKKSKAETNMPETTLTRQIIKTESSSIKGKKVTMGSKQQNIELPKTIFGTILGSKSTEKENVIETKSYQDKLKNNELLQKAIAEIESIGSSSESEEMPEELEEEVQKDWFVLEDPKKLLEYENLSAAELTSNEELDKKSQKELAIFDMFEDVVEIDEISLALTDDLMVKHQIDVEIDPTVSKDTGKFVNPITGARSASSSSQSTISKEDEIHHSIEEESELEEIENEKRIFQDSDDSTADLIKPADDFDDVPEPIKADDEDILQEFFGKEQEIETNVLDEYNAANVLLIRQEQERLNLQHTLDFLNSVIDHCVAKAEYIDDNIILRKSLDKMKLIKELKATYDLLEVQKRENRFLNRKCAEHFKRKCSFRLISADDPKTIKNDIKKYSNALDILDNWLFTEEQVKQHCSFQVLEMRNQFKEVEQRSITKVGQLEQLIKTTFQCDNHNKLLTSVQNSLNKISVIRKEISDVRFRLLIKQHDVSELGQQRKKLEDLGNGLHLTQYETLETETNVLSKKLEERNSTLKKLHKHYNSDLHSLAHLKEKQNISRHIVNIQKQFFKQLQQEKEDYRTIISELKSERQKLRTDIRNLSFQSGLLDKPVLMKDYDETVETVDKLHRTIEHLKGSIEALTIKIAELEQM